MLKDSPEVNKKANIKSLYLSTLMQSPNLSVRFCSSMNPKSLLLRYFRFMQIKTEDIVGQQYKDLRKCDYLYPFFCLDLFTLAISCGPKPQEGRFDIGYTAIYSAP